MNFIKTLLLFFYIIAFVCAARAESLVLEGKIPGQYLSRDKNQTFHGAIVIDQESGLITSVIDLSDLGNLNAILAYQQAAASGRHLQLKRGEKWDVIYPGLIDLHNHTKQNNLGVWKHAHGQFENRFEWRAWSVYKKSVSGNMNPWIGYGKAINCAAFRWSELQAMVAGTVYLQGPSYCVDDFAIHKVESTRSFPHSKKQAVQAPTDLVLPGDMVYLWNELRPEIKRIQSGKDPNSQSYRLAYETALANAINKTCDTTKLGMTMTAQKVRDREIIKEVLTNQELLKEACPNPPDRFIRYVYWVHKTINSKKLYAEAIETGEGSAIIAHLAEGRRHDHYNTKEFEMVKLMGMDRPYVNFVHAVGVDADGYAHMAKQNMGIIWSPFSNLILYNETMDIKAAIEKGVTIALGSDWLPTGTKGPLEELKVAYRYVEAQGLENALAQMPGADSSDEALYKMVAENPAKLINHAYKEGEKGGIGTIANNAMASLIVTSELSENPFTNLVRSVTETDINLVVVDGKIQYGNSQYLNAVDLEFEEIPNGEQGMKEVKNLVAVDDVLANTNPKAKKDEKQDYLKELGSIITRHKSSRNENDNDCVFSGDKGFVHQNTDEGDLIKVGGNGIDIDTFKGIQRILGINLLTQSRNRNDVDRGDPEFQVETFTPLYTCNDPYHQARVNELISKTWPADRANREKRIREQELGQTPQRMAEQYPD